MPRVRQALTPWQHTFVNFGTGWSGGVWINPGDLLHGDQYGVVAIPHEIAERIPDAAERDAADEQRIIQACHAEGITVERLKAAYKSVRPMLTGPDPLGPAPHYPLPFSLRPSGAPHRLLPLRGAKEMKAKQSLAYALKDDL